MSEGIVKVEKLNEDDQQELAQAAATATAPARTAYAREANVEQKVIPEDKLNCTTSEVPAPTKSTGSELNCDTSPQKDESETLAATATSEVPSVLTKNIAAQGDEVVKIKSEEPNDKYPGTGKISPIIEDTVVTKTQELQQKDNSDGDVPPIQVKSEPHFDDAIGTREDGELTPEPQETDLNVTANVQVAQSMEEVDNLPDNFFEDLLQSADDIGTAAGQIDMSADTVRESSEQEASHIPVKCEPDESTAAQETSIGAEAIPADSFFDDLLVDSLRERLANAEHEDLETKYSEKLKELHRLNVENEEPGSKSHKKHKKNKKKDKKSRKRERCEEQQESRSAERKDTRKRRSQSPEERVTIKKEICGEPVSTSLNYGTLNKVGEKRQPRSSQPANMENEQPSTSATASISVMPVDTLPREHRPLTVKTEFFTTTPSIYEEQLECQPVHYPTATTADGTSSGNAVDVECNAFPSFKRIKLEKITSKPAALETEVIEVLTPKVKRERASILTMAILKAFRSAHEQKDAMPPLTNFLYTATVRKLPVSSSYVKQQIYENRSPLHTVNNVCFKFNSHVTRPNLREWGLEGMSSVTAKIANMIGYDAQTLHKKLKATNLPMKLKKIKREQNAADGEALEETRSSFFTNAMTQTDAVTVISGAGQCKSREIGVQAGTICGSIGTQTNAAVAERQSETNEDLPLMKMMGQLNENQLLALSDFAELICEPATSAMDMYRLRQRMVEIYKCSKMPSAVAPTAPEMTRDFNSRDPRAHSHFGVHQHVPLDPRQQSAPHLQRHYLNPHPPSPLPQQKLYTPNAPGHDASYQRQIPQPLPPAHFSHYAPNSQRR